MTFRRFRMTGTRVMFLIDRVMYKRSFHRFENVRLSRVQQFNCPANNAIFRSCSGNQMTNVTRIHAIDSHTGGEPTRVVTEGFPDLGSGSMSDRLEIFRHEFNHLRSSIVCEPRGHAAIVGALLCEPVDNTAAAGVIFFNNVSYLGMCGHGTIGLIKTLEYMGRIGPGVHKIETPVGAVDAELNENGSVTITNVASYRVVKDVEGE